MTGLLGRDGDRDVRTGLSSIVLNRAHDLTDNIYSCATGIPGCAYIREYNGDSVGSDYAPHLLAFAQQPASLSDSRLS
jgi:hypothetical protein